MLRRYFFLPRSSSASPVDLTAEDEASGKAENGAGDGVVQAAKEGRESIFLGNALGRLEEAINSLPPVISAMKGNAGPRVAVGVFLALTFLLIIVRETMARKATESQHGSVADLVRRGQLKSHRRGISTPLKYEDPFNNPLVKVNKGNSSVEMCGKVYSLSPLTLTAEQQSSHQRRRSRAYQWKRPTVFLKEGDDVPPEVDPDTVRWIPANHPFATTVSDLDEDLVRSNVHQRSGVPFRVRAEHEALQKKLEAQQSDQMPNRVVAVGPSETRELEGAFKSPPGTHDELESILAVDWPGGGQSADMASDSSDRNVPEEPIRS
ncbi:unnamed protein product [Spirodela intermedia]|uniref:Uncharacterized protein n=1 Tax=Spirodela intermedia TaxID=51605 RepID=A0A7I8KP51_SPIIN|nr:unnamed protein product [Spirodela intermedia]